MSPYADTVMPLDLAKRMVEQRGGVATIRHGCLEIHLSGEMIGLVRISGEAVRFLDITNAFAVHEAPKRLQ